MTVWAHEVEVKGGKSPLTIAQAKGKVAPGTTVGLKVDRTEKGRDLAVRPATQTPQKKKKPMARRRGHTILKKSQ